MTAGSSHFCALLKSMCIAAGSSNALTKVPQGTLLVFAVSEIVSSFEDVTLEVDCSSLGYLYVEKVYRKKLALQILDIVLLLIRADDNIVLSAYCRLNVVVRVIEEIVTYVELVAVVSGGFFTFGCFVPRNFHYVSSNICYPATMLVAPISLLYIRTI